jgi:hypothetical protein
MNRRILALAVLFLAVGMLPLAADPEKSIAIGGKFGFADIGVSADFPVGPLVITPGIGYPGGLWFLGEMLDVFNLPFVTEPGPTFTLDVTYPVSIGERFDLKLGANIWIMPDINFSGMWGTAGLSVRPEYWFGDGRWGIVWNLNVPLIHYGWPSLSGNFFNEFDPTLPLFGLLTSSLGVLYSL